MAKLKPGYVDRVPPRTDDPSRVNDMRSQRSTLPGATAGEILENVVSDILRAGTRTGYRGVIDVQVDLHKSVIDSNGFIVALFSGKESTTSSVSVKLATRVNLADLDAIV